MKKLLSLMVILSIFGCKTEPKDYVSLSGKIANKNSDSLTIRSRSYSKTIPLSEDGSFSDTLKTETGMYNLYDGKEITSVFLKNGFDINLTFDAAEFDETISYSGNGAEHSNYLAKSNLLHEKLLNPSAFDNLDMEGLKTKLSSIENELTTFYNSNPKIDTSITNSFKNQLKPMLRSYERYFSQSIGLKSVLPKGSPSPSFTNYENYKGGKTSLSDLKGKYVYIDIWATWCGPCKAEIPSLKKLEKEYHDKNIQFVSLSVDDGRGYRGKTKEESSKLAKEGWKNMIAEKELGGIQIIAPKGWQSQFIQEYKINGIPRFILLDPNGSIVSPDAPRPSNPKLRDVFKSLNI
ncbi:TlpA family protein disulfide reductase [Hyunsoonleella flava]|uniref:TlpA family protein disulfide reductase n=1 Tax=Hyunsoonleella flava TaxID=2527939 RepID=A0A4Q9FHZ6_9FLAO|nr:TlpA disulfide reductase family protein [Hyunsoonleella flava]TBN06591.1 TlpA family protein disulfide reductase [Hyunsoonleella flava]